MNNNEPVPKGKCPHCQGEVTLANVLKETKRLALLSRKSCMFVRIAAAS
ncbi:MAG: hypothetical protein ABIE43_05085 [Patescibacteria group bacterium]